jgi:predicted RNA-binding Zn ribbon-like protein
MTPELWRSPAIATDWLRGRGLLAPGVELDAADLRRAITVREGVRSMLFENNSHESGGAPVVELNETLRECPVTIQFDPLDRSPQLVAPDATCSGALATLATIIALAQLDDSFGRLKACPGPDCGWAFYDHSRNRTSAWCSMSICGARVKARSYRARCRREAH